MGGNLGALFHQQIRIERQYSSNISEAIELMTMDWGKSRVAGKALD
jgi:hypothetical protein